MKEVGGFDGVEWGSLLKPEGFQEAGERGVCVGAVLRAALKRTITDNDMGTDGALGRIVMTRETRDVQEGEDGFVVF